MPVFNTVATVLHNQELIRNHMVMVCEAPGLAAVARPGHFVNILASESVSSILRKPFSIFHADPAAGTVAVLYQLKGATTIGMARKAPGDQVDLVGPLGGKLFELDSRPDAHHVMVGGGYGVPPLVFLCERLLADQPGARVTFIVGAKSKARLLCEAELKTLGVDVVCTTEDGTHGLRGQVTDALQKQIDHTSAVYCCGPTGMMQAVGNACIAANIPCQVSLEVQMPCGVGVCMGCVVDLAGGQRVRACTDGPVFDARIVVWK